MRTISQLNSISKFEVQDNSVAYLTVEQLKKYKEVANKFLSQDTKDIIDWLIVNNETYMSELPGSDSNDNALFGFYNSGMPSDESYKELWKKINNVVKSGRALEIPLFLTQDQFNAVVDKKISLDSIVIDLVSERSRNALVKQYQPLIWKIVNQWSSKTVLSKEDLYSAALEGFTWAMNGYGKKSPTRLKKEMNMSDDEKKKWENKLNNAMTFSQYAAYMIYTGITEAVKDESRTVRVARSAQNKEKKINGSIKAVNTVSGDSVTTTNKDGNTKNIFDYIGSTNNVAKKLNDEDLQRYFKVLYDKLEQKFDRKILDIWYSYHGLNGYEKLTNKELSKKYNIGPSNITYYLYKVNSYIRKDPKMFKLINEINELMKECLNDIDREGEEFDVVYTNKLNDINDNSDLDFNEIY